MKHVFRIQTKQNETGDFKGIISLGNCVKNGTLVSPRPSALDYSGQLREKWHRLPVSYRREDILADGSEAT